MIFSLPDLDRECKVVWLGLSDMQSASFKHDRIRPEASHLADKRPALVIGD